MWIELDGRGPLHRQTYRAVRDRILAGDLAPGARLPATRVLARDAGLARNTVSHAYAQLVDEGYAVTRTGAGTFVATTLPEERVAVAPPARRSREGGAGVDASPPLSRYARRTFESAPRRLAWGVPRRHLPYDFRYGEPGWMDLPLPSWQRIRARRSRRASVSHLGYGAPAGAPELRRALRAYLRRARGVECDAEQILVVNGSQQAIDLVGRVLVDAGDRVAIEEPGYTGFTHALEAYGAELFPVAVDEHGLDVEALSRASRVRGVCVTPSHQFPTGGVMSLARRLELLAWAEREGAFVLEDDYDGEFRYDGRPIECLQGLDGTGRALYVGSASKVLFPSLRIGWLVVPEPLAPAFALAKALSDTGSATLDQLALADFIEEGQLERHVRRSRVRNAARREALQAAVQESLGGAAELVGVRAGLHGLLWIRELKASREAELRRLCATRGVGIYPVIPYYRSPPPVAGFVLGFATLDEERIREGIRILARCLSELARRGTPLRVDG